MRRNWNHISKLNNGLVMAKKREQKSLSSLIGKGGKITYYLKITVEQFLPYFLRRGATPGDAPDG